MFDGVLWCVDILVNLIFKIINSLVFQEFTCREITECPDDLVLFFVTHSEQSRFLSTLRQLWQDKITDNTEFPVVLVPETDSFGSLCTKQFHEINRSWEPLISASLGYPQ